MQVPEDELWDRLEAAVESEASESRLEEVREVVRHAEAAGQLDLLVEARLQLVQARFEWAPGREAWPDLLAAYTRCVALYAETPERFAEGHLDLLWQGLAIVGMVMVHLADRPAAQIRAVLDDMQPRCRPDRNDLFLIYMLRMMLEARIGNLAAADAALRRLRTLEPPDYINPGTAALEQVRYLADLGRDDEAIEAMEPLLSGRIPFDDGQGGGREDPRDKLAFLLLPYLRTGRPAEARDAFRRTRRRIADELELAAHLEFCTLSGNEDAGKEILETLEDSDEPAEMYNEMRVSAASALLCGRMVDLGRGEETVTMEPPSGVPGAEKRARTFADLFDECARDALGFARELDARNGTTYQSDRMHELIHREPIVESLPLSLAARAKSRLARAGAARRAAGPDRMDEPREPAALLAEAERAFQLMERDRARALLDLHDEAVPEGYEEDAEAAEAAARRAELRALTAEDPALREEELPAVAERFRALGLEVRAQACLGRLGLWRCMNGRVAEGIPLVAGAVAALGASGDRHLAAGAEIWMGHARHAAGEHDEAVAAYRRAGELVAEPGDDPPRAAVLRGTAALYRADTLARPFAAVSGERDGDGAGPGEERVAEATEAAEAAIEAYRAAGHGIGTADACLVRAGIARMTGDAETALRFYADCAAAAGAGTDQAATARAMRGEMMLESGDADAAIPELVEAVAAYTALDDRRAAYARVTLATAYRCFDRWLDLAEAAEEAIPELDAREDAPPGLALQARWMLVQAYDELGHDDEALRVVDEMLDREDDPAAIGTLHRKAGDVLFAGPRAADRFRLAAEAYGRAGRPFDEAYCRRQQAKAFAYADMEDAAIALFDQVRDALDRLPEDPGHTTGDGDTTGGTDGGDTGGGSTDGEGDTTGDTSGDTDSHGGGTGGHDTVDGGGDTGGGGSAAYERACWAYDAARILADAGRFGEAAKLALAAGEGFRSLGEDRAAAAGDLIAAHALHDAGRPREAGEPLRRALAALPEDGPERADADELLARITRPGSR